jgi:hypothetical protein
MAVAVTTTENLGKAVGTLSHIIAQRDETMYLNILHPQQVSNYYHWLSQHRQSVRVMMTRSVSPVTTSSAMDMNSAPTTLSPKSTTEVGTNVAISDGMSLQTISRRLSEVLQISSRQDYDKDFAYHITNKSG